MARSGCFNIHKFNMISVRFFLLYVIIRNQRRSCIVLVLCIWNYMVPWRNCISGLSIPFFSRLVLINCIKHVQILIIFLRGLCLLMAPKYHLIVVLVTWIWIKCQMIDIHFLNFNHLLQISGFDLLYLFCLVCLSFYRSFCIVIKVCTIRIGLDT